MGWVTDLVRDFPTLAVAKERLCLAEDRQKLLEQENENLRQQVAELTQQVESLLAATATADEEQEFTRYRGLLWSREGAGFEPTPYCPDCRRPMLGFPIPTAPMQWLCRPCKRSVSYMKPPEA